MLVNGIESTGLSLGRLGLIDSKLFFSLCRDGISYADDFKVRTKQERVIDCREPSDGSHKGVELFFVVLLVLVGDCCV